MRFPCRCLRIDATSISCVNHRTRRCYRLNPSSLLRYVTSFYFSFQCILDFQALYLVEPVCRMIVGMMILFAIFFNRIQASRSLRLASRVLRGIRKTGTPWEGERAAVLERGWVNIFSSHSRNGIPFRSHSVFDPSSGHARGPI